MTRSRRICAVLLLAAALLVPWAASAAPRSPAEIRTASPALLPRLWSLLTALWADAGCGLDPSGSCHGGPQSTAPASPAFFDEGCGIDPDGRCGSSH